MELPKMAADIIRMIDERFDDLDNDCIDIVQIKNVCTLYKNKKSTREKSIPLSKLSFTSPDFTKGKSSKFKKQVDILKSDEFLKKYSLFIKIIHASLILNIDIFDYDDSIVVLKNNYEIIKVYNKKKKELISNQINILKNVHKNVDKKIEPSISELQAHNTDFMMEISIVDRLKYLMNRLIDQNTQTPSDNLLSLIMPYFYKPIEFIERYNCD